MQALELLLLAGGALVAAAYVLVRYQRSSDSDRVIPRVLIGVVPGLAGAGLVLVSRMDFVPDDAEGLLWGVALVGITGLAIVAASYRLVRH